MPCTPCQARRRMIAAAKANGGMTGAVKALPAIGWHVFRQISAKPTQEAVHNTEQN